MCGIFGIITQDEQVLGPVLIDAAKNGNILEFGFYLHQYQDTWAHQGFSPFTMKNLFTKFSFSSSLFGFGISKSVWPSREKS